MARKQSIAIQKHVKSCLKNTNGKQVCYEKDFIKDISEETIKEELRRVASYLNKNTLTKAEFDSVANVKSATVARYFKSWNKALESAGLKVSLRLNIRDEEIFDEIKKVWNEVGRRPTQSDFDKYSSFSSGLVKKRFGGFLNAIEKFLEKERKDNNSQKNIIAANKDKIENSGGKHKDRFYGADINFRGMRHAPLNELGVVFLFGMIAKDLGFDVESINAAFPDCEAKQRIKAKNEIKLKKVYIEFEYKSSKFKSHNHPVDKCDIIVCWINDWAECPITVLELSKEILKLE